MRATDNRPIFRLAVAAAICSAVVSGCSGAKTPSANATPDASSLGACVDAAGIHAAGLTRDRATC